MKNLIRVFFIIAFFFSSTNNLFSQPTSQKGVFQKNIPIHKFEWNRAIVHWILLGPLANPPSTKMMPDGTFNIGFFHDYLKNLGGESNAQLKADEKVRIILPGGETKITKTITARSDDNKLVDLRKYFGPLDDQAAYAFCYLYSDKDQTGGLLIASDDGIKIWLNGELVHANNAARGLNFWDDKVKIKLKKGLNPLLIKITQYVREWAFSIKPISSAAYDSLLQKEKEKAELIEFLNMNLVMKERNRWNWFFIPGEFPELVWEKPGLADKVLGSYQIKVKWFDGQLNELKAPKEPGRYLYYAQVENENNIPVTRAGTFYCLPQDWMIWGEKLEAELKYIPLAQFDKKAWEIHREAIANFAGRIILLSMLDQKEGAILLSYLHDMQPWNNDKIIDDPLIMDETIHLKLKRKLLQVENKWPALKPPHEDVRLNSLVLQDGTEEDAGIKRGTALKLDKLCKQWYKDSKVPFVTLVARHGKIFFHKAYGEDPDGPFTLNTTTEIASITKLLTGLLFAQFVDQGLIGLDDPVGKFLPDFPTQGKKALTLRQCFTHTSGLWSHEEFGGVHDPWLDSKVSSLLSYLEVGKVHNYNGMGYDLAGKVMEVVSGQNIFNLFKKQLFEPLHLKHTVLLEDLAFGCHTTAEELAIIGQMMLNKGSYGKTFFFSEETFNEFLPKPLKTYYPDLNTNIDWGIGITWMREKGVSKNGKKVEKYLLSKNVIGHGSATSCVLRVDLDNDLIITQVRRKGGKAYDEYLKKFLFILDKGLKK